MKKDIFKKSVVEDSIDLNSCKYVFSFIIYEQLMDIDGQKFYAYHKENIRRIFLKIGRVLPIS